MKLSNDEKNIYDHILNGEKSHIELTLRSGGLNMRQTYLVIMRLIDKKLIVRTNNNKFKYR